MITAHLDSIAVPPSAIKTVTERMHKRFVLEYRANQA